MIEPGNADNEKNLSTFNSGTEINSRYFHVFFSHPDYTVGTGITPVHAQRLADYTAGRESHPAPKNLFHFLNLD